MSAGGPVEVARTTWRWQAEMALETLRAEGVDGVVVADDVGGQYAGIAPARLLVAAEDVERAREVLGRIEAGEYAANDEDDPPDDEEPAGRLD